MVLGCVCFSSAGFQEHLELGVPTQSGARGFRFFYSSPGSLQFVFLNIWCWEVNLSWFFGMDMNGLVLWSGE